MANATATPAAVQATTQVDPATVGGDAVVVSAVPAPDIVLATTEFPTARVYQPYDTWRPRFSPDHQVMLVCRTAPGDHDTTLTSMTLWAFSPDGFDGDQSLKVLGLPSASGWVTYGHPEWSADSAAVVIFAETSTEWKILSLDSTDYTNVFATIYTATKPDLATDPSFARDGSVYFVEASGSNYYIATVSASATPVHTRLLTSSHVLSDPTVSPDGTTILYAERVSAPDMSHAFGVWALKTMPIGGGSPTTVLDDGNAHRHPTWQTNRTILFQTYRYGTDSTQQVARIHTNGAMHAVLGEGEYPEAQKI